MRGIYYHFNELENVSGDFLRSGKWIKKREGKEKRRILYLNIPMSFDIEVSSFYDENGAKAACMYIWMFAICDKVFVGRTWGEFKQFIDELSKMTGVREDKRIVIYVHNLAYEMQFIKDKFNFTNVFSIDERKPLYARTYNGIEFRCSYLLSGKKLEKIGEEVGIDKMVGDLDYSLVRGPETPISDDEMQYCINDVLIVTKYIENEIKKNGDITRIPMTMTGYVRRYCRNYCLHNEKGKWDYGYKSLMKKLTIEPDEYLLLRDAIIGGFTHASCLNVRKTLKDLDSFDLTSAYPAAMLSSDNFPVGPGRKVNIDNEYDMLEYMACYCCIFRIKLKNVESKRDYEHYISKSRCLTLSDDAVIDNGRVISASELTIAITEIDYRLIRFYYNWNDEETEISDFYIYQKGYLPKKLIECVLYFYKLKTELKEVEGKEEEYAIGKSNLNSIYGMIVTSIIRGIITFSDGEWGEKSPNLNEEIEKYNNNANRFLFYPWGIYITALVRETLHIFISRAGKNRDYAYSDTDSVKTKNGEKYLPFVKEYNEKVWANIEKCLNYYKIPLDAYQPKNKFGEVKKLGGWDWETKNGSKYEYFKTLGAKRYIYKQNGEWHMTVAGTGKRQSMKYLEDKYKTDNFILNAFDNDLEIPAEYTGKMTHTYSDVRCSGKTKDYLGNEFEYYEDSFVHLEPCSFSMTMSDEFMSLLYSIRTFEK